MQQRSRVEGRGRRRSAVQTAPPWRSLTAGTESGNAPQSPTDCSSTPEISLPEGGGVIYMVHIIFTKNFIIQSGNKLQEEIPDRSTDKLSFQECVLPGAVPLPANRGRCLQCCCCSSLWA